MAELSVQLILFEAIIGLLITSHFTLYRFIIKEPWEDILKKMRQEEKALRRKKYLTTIEIVVEELPKTNKELIKKLDDVDEIGNRESEVRSDIVQIEKYQQNCGSVSFGSVVFGLIVLITFPLFSETYLQIFIPPDYSILSLIMTVIGLLLIFSLIFIYNIGNVISENKKKFDRNEADKEKEKTAEEMFELLKKIKE